MTQSSTRQDETKGTPGFTPGEKESMTARTIRLIREDERAKLIARVRELEGALRGVAHRSDDGGCWCDAFQSAFQTHLPHCEIARAALSGEEKNG